MAISERKAALAAEERAKRTEDRQRRAAFRRCWWTWPLGHRWGPSVGGSAEWSWCQVCGCARVHVP